MVSSIRCAFSSPPSVFDFGRLFFLDFLMAGVVGGALMWLEPASTVLFSDNGMGIRVRFYNENYQNN